MPRNSPKTSRKLYTQFGFKCTREMKNEIERSSIATHLNAREYVRQAVQAAIERDREVVRQVLDKRETP